MDIYRFTTSKCPCLACASVRHGVRKCKVRLEVVPCCSKLTHSISGLFWAVLYCTWLCQKKKKTCTWSLVKSDNGRVKLRRVTISHSICKMQSGTMDIPSIVPDAIKIFTAKSMPHTVNNRWLTQYNQCLTLFNRCITTRRIVIVTKIRVRNHLEKNAENNR